MAADRAELALLRRRGGILFNLLKTFLRKTFTDLNRSPDLKNFLLVLKFSGEPFNTFWLSISPRTSPLVQLRVVVLLLCVLSQNHRLSDGQLDVISIRYSRGLKLLHLGCLAVWLSATHRLIFLNHANTEKSYESKRCK